IVGSLLKVPPEFQSEALFVVSGVVIIFYFNLLFSVYNSILQGLQRMDVTNAIMVVSKVFRALGMWFFLAHGYGLRGLIVNGAIFSSLVIGINILWSKKLLSGLRVNPSLFSFLKLKQIASYSINVFIARIIALGQDPINKIILAWYGSFYFVSFYEIGWRVSMMVRQLFSIGITPLLPASSELDSLRGLEELEKIYLSVSRLFYFFATPVFLVVIVLADPLVQVWLGDGYKLVAIAIQLLLLGNFFSLLVTPQYFILLGIGKPQINTIAHALGAGINVILAIVLVYYIGFYGVLISGLISFLVSSLYIDFQFRKITSSDLSKYIRVVPGYAILAALILAGSLAYATTFVWKWHFAKLIGFAMGFLCLYLAVLKFTGAFNNADKENMIHLIRSLRLST
ncbi:MAG: polysaccharide biosynthesis C-terminal domain-containing protein, partial [Candidatus Aenigmarchaeota archaeon]|nr:polysaccharide biosynthesis C-terminal domain-containing protein [Candidatus Aenigmarchaeota archaeon]